MEQLYGHPFYSRAMGTGKLPENKFKEYMIQDSIYLKHYARVYGQAIYCSKRLKDIQTFYSILNFVTDLRSRPFLEFRYLKKYGVTDDDIESIKPLPENQNYIDFLLSQAKGQNVCEMLMAVLPCMMSYSYIFRRLAKKSARQAIEISGLYRRLCRRQIFRKL